MTSLQEEQFETFEKHFPLGSRVLSVKILMQGGIWMTHMPPVGYTANRFQLFRIKRKESKRKTSENISSCC